MTEQSTDGKRLAIFTIAVRIDPETNLGGVYAVDTKYGYLDDIVEYGCLVQDENGELRSAW